MSVRGDNPIKNIDDDRLGRAESASTFALQLQELDASEGLVVGVLGPWGTGKTSFINLVRNDLNAAKIPVLDFNPWMFSGTSQLVDTFFIEISSQLKLKNDRLKDIGKDLEEYGDALFGLAWLPGVGVWIERFRLLGKGANKILQRRKQGTGSTRNKVTKALSSLEKPIVVVVDDIDRLSTAEIRDIFKLVRLTASFPNIIYVLAFDRARVEQALEDTGMPGRDYLEKILQLAIDLPVAPPDVINDQVFAAVTEALEGIEKEGPFDQDAWPDIYYEVIRPLIKNMRDVRRYSVAIRGTVKALDGKIALQDVLALEAIRIFLPDVYQEIVKSVEGLTTQSEGYGSRDEPAHLKASIDRILEVAGPRKELVEDLIKRVFPSAERHMGGTYYGHGSHRQWLKDRRLAHESMLKLYLEKQGNEKFDSYARAEHAFKLLADEGEFETYLRSLPPEKLSDTIAALENFEDEYPVEAVIPGITVLLKITPDIPEKPVTSMFDFGTRTVVGRVVYRLLKRLPTPEATYQSVTEILPKLKSLTAKYELITDVGYREGAGHKLVSETDAKTLEESLRADIRNASPTKLSTEDELIRLILMMRDTEVLPEYVMPSNYKLTHAILLGCRSQVRSNSMGNRAVRTSYRLAWDLLLEFFGGADNLKRKVNAARSRYPENADLYELFDKYASGWRPERDE